MTSFLSTSLATLGTKRRVFFSFHYDDIMRVNNVRNAWKITHPDSAAMRSFYDSSLWESKKLEGDEAVKRLIREGVEHTSAVCVLIGSGTWQRRWVRYEIARAIVDGRGLLGVHINGLNHHERRVPDAFGPNPLDNMAIGRVQEGLLGTAKYHLYEWAAGAWQRYADYQSAVPVPRWVSEARISGLLRLSQVTSTYDYCRQDGHKNIGAWVDAAASQAGR